ncbi:MAG: hypothetical protein WAW17_14645 [Rhodococcus sp. (in: high G+C Gram-positive bacteria)]|uniref:hypothetical protein n=1 Tax=Rhodococcus sp. TaxID=1831 RepID=UPI003BAE152A
MVAAFLDMDNRQSIAAAAVDASLQLTPERGIRRLWEPVRDSCYQAATAYLDAEDQFGSVQTPAAAAAFEQVTRQLVTATQKLDEFYAAHRGHLDEAGAMFAAVPQLAQQAVQVAQNAREGLQGAGEAYADYPSVRAGDAALEAALAALRGARAANEIRSAAARVRDESAALEKALAAAPAKDRDARNAVASVTTRIAAVETRSERLSPAYSALLREFNAASSADLVHNERESHRHLEQARTDLQQAQTALRTGNPEVALELTGAARTHLADAEAKVDGVTDRLRLLRTVRENPRAKENEIRFHLRDAQMLAVNCGLVREWGSVLDAQLERIDRIAGTLTGRHPDYWAYITQLDAVSDFISEVVHKMRGHVAQK